MRTTPFGQGCLLARRLVERGVPFVEVTLSSVDGANALGWDTHAQNFDRVRQLSEVLDAGWSTLIRDLQQEGFNLNGIKRLLDDSDGTLGLGVPEIAIYRRLDRSGDGEYRLAGARCRLNDVQELLAPGSAAPFHLAGETKTRFSDQ